MENGTLGPAPFPGAIRVREELEKLGFDRTSNDAEDSYTLGYIRGVDAVLKTLQPLAESTRKGDLQLWQMGVRRYHVSAILHWLRMKWGTLRDAIIRKCAELTAAQEKARSVSC